MNEDHSQDGKIIRIMPSSQYLKANSRLSTDFMPDVTVDHRIGQSNLGGSDTGDSHATG